MQRRKLTPPAIAREWGINPQKVISFIDAGELRAINAASPGATKPRYLIDVDDLAEFEAKRSTIQPSDEEQS